MQIDAVEGAFPTLREVEFYPFESERRDRISRLDYRGEHDG
jgi:hypothetical protein